MTAGQMLLAGFNGLFTKVENELSSLLGLMRNLEMDEKDQNLDIVKESQNLSISTTERNTELLFQLFFVKRLEVMISFFVAARLMTLTLRGKKTSIRWNGYYLGRGVSLSSKVIHATCYAEGCDLGSSWYVPWGNL